MASEIANVLIATLSADTNTRIAAELRINELFRTPGSLAGAFISYYAISCLSHPMPATLLGL